MTQPGMENVFVGNVGWPLSEPIAGALLSWKQKALSISPLEAYPEKEVNPEYLKAIHLEEELAKEGYSLAWGDIAELDRYIDIDHYERIVWTDREGAKWLLAARSRGEVPLKIHL
jgi:hypothetical protein